MKLKKLFTIVLAGLITFTSLGALGGCSKEKSLKELYGNKTFLQVGVYDGGIGVEWVEKIAAEFEKRYEGVKLEGEDSENEGLKIVVNKSKSYTTGIDQILENEERNVFFCGGVDYKSFINKGLLMDITDVVTGDLSAVSLGAETGTIENKLYGKSNSFVNYGGKYYAIPFYSSDGGITYDRGLFLEKGFFFREEPLVEEVVVAGRPMTITHEFTNDPALFSVGPDGVRGTYDDGLPSSHEEFYKLCNYIYTNGCEPLIFTNEHKFYYNYAALGAFTNSLTADQLNAYYTYDSCATTVDIVTGFNGNEPNVQAKTINSTNQYDLTQSYAKYLAVKFSEGLATGGNGNYLSKHCANRLDHLKTQSEFVYSALKGGSTAPIAMMIEGTYWYGEAKGYGVFKRTVETYKEKAENRNFAFMPLPWKETGRVEEGEGKPLTLNNAPGNYAFINNNIKDNELLTRLAKEFVQFVYTEWGLKTFTQTANIRMAVDYTMKDSDMTNMDAFGKSIMVAAREAQMAYPTKDCAFYMDHQSALGFGVDTNFWKSQTHNSYLLITQFRDKDVSAKDFFLGLKYDSQKWNDLIVGK